VEPGRDLGHVDRKKDEAAAKGERTNDAEGLSGEKNTACDDCVLNR
jgi:hypothetical protein